VAVILSVAGAFARERTGGVEGSLPSVIPIQI